MLGSVGVGLMNFIMTIIALLLVDKLGRKPLLIIGTAGVIIALFFTGGCDLFLQSGTLKGYLVMGGLIGFILFFCYRSRRGRLVSYFGTVAPCLSEEGEWLWPFF